MHISSIKKSKKIAILGFGREGKSTLDFLLSLWIKEIDILDKNIHPLAKRWWVKPVFWEHYLGNLGDYDLIIKSPGISPYHEKIAPHKDRLTSQTEIFFNNYSGKVIWISGTKGKSTSSTLIFQTLKNAGKKVKLVGNIGSPVLDEIHILDTTESYDFIVYELSSYMLENFSPKLEVWLLVNIFPDHLDWHHGIENYAQAKLNVLKNAKHAFAHSSLVSSPLWKELAEDIKEKLSAVQFYWTGTKNSFQTTKKILLQGQHNLENIMWVASICDVLNIDKKYLENTLETFSGLPHRLETVGNYHGITFINDAISTTPDSTIAAIKTFWTDIGTIFLGGTDRGYNFEELLKNIKKYDIKNIVLFPESGKKILSLLSNDERKNYTVLETASMEAAVRFAYQNTLPWNICLLSCASPSYSLWKNYEEKGREFREWVEKMWGE